MSSQLIHKDLKKRLIANSFIGNNLKLVYDLNKCLVHRILRGLLLDISIEIAFYSLEWIFVKKFLADFGFGDVCIWIRHSTQLLNQLL